MIFKTLSFGVIYVGLLLEIIYHIQEKPWMYILSISCLFSLYYIFTILFFRKKLDIKHEFQTIILFLFLVLIIINTTFTADGLVDAILTKKLPQSFYGVHLLYWLPFIYILWRILPRSHFLMIKLSYWTLSFTFILAVSLELYHLYILGNAENLVQVFALGNHFSILYLPIIWAVISSIMIYFGLKNTIPEISKIGFALIAIMVIKLYAYDVWQMDNVSRIIAFIILGIILLLSSFLFQRLKNIIKTLVETKEEKTEQDNTDH